MGYLHIDGICSNCGRTNTKCNIDNCPHPLSETRWYDWLFWFLIIVLFIIIGLIVT